MVKQQLLPPNPMLPSIREGLSKRQISELAQQTVSAALEQEAGLPVAEALAAMEEFAKQVRRDERFVDLLRHEVLLHNGVLKTASGAKVEACEAGVQYNYAQDGGWRLLTQQINSLLEQRRQLEERLRRIAPGKTWVDTETGELLEGPAKISKSTYRITLAR